MAFDSSASNLVGNDLNNVSDVFIRDMSKRPGTPGASEVVQMWLKGTSATGAWLRWR